MPCHATNSDFVGHCHVMPQYRLCRTSHALSAQIIRTKTVSANVTATVLSSLTECVCGGPQYAKPCKDDMSADVKYTNRQGSTPTYEAVHRDMRPRCSIRSTHLLQQARRPAERHVTKVVSEHLGPAPLPSTAPPPPLASASRFCLLTCPHTRVLTARMPAGGVIAAAVGALVRPLLLPLPLLPADEAASAVRAADAWPGVWAAGLIRRGAWAGPRSRTGA